MDNKKNFVFSKIYENYINSDGFNGLAIYNIPFDGTKEELLSILQELIIEGKIDVIYGTNNTHIKHFDAAPVREQIENLQRLSFTSYCLFPTKNVLRDKRDVSDFEGRPFSRMLALGEPQFQCLFFNIEILHKYASDPRYDYKFSDYSGSIYAYDTVDDVDNIYLRSFAIGRNGKDYVAAAFPRDLDLCPAVAQQQWFSKMINDTSNCSVVENFYKNQFDCCWHFPRTIYRAITEEIENIYELTNKIWGIPLFKRIYHKNSEELRNFDMLWLPTNKNLDDFFRQLEIITIENLNKKFFEINEFKLELEIYKEEGNFVERKQKGTMLLLKDWLAKVKPDCITEIHGALKKLRDLRNEASAHNIIKLQYSNEYYNTQFDTAKSIGDALNILRRIIQSHPKASEITIPHNSNTYMRL